jgi:iron complex outermembrane recepter protein
VPRATGYRVVAALALACASIGVEAQDRTSENAVAAAEDAFGVTIGRETLGLYTSSSVRGFSPTAAGNARIDGLYFDQVWTLNSRLRRTTTIRVGPSAQSYPFPAPTGIVDHSLKRPDSDGSFSLIVSADNWGTGAFEADGVLPLIADELSLSLGGAFTNEKYFNGTDGRYGNVGGVLRWSPSETFDLRAFAARSEVRYDEFGPIYVPGGAFLPPRVARRQFLGPEWADYDSTAENRGLVATYATGESWQFRAGVFHTLYDDRATYSILMLDVQPDGSSEQVIIADSNTGDASTSGELRATYRTGTGNTRHSLHFSLRARERRRHYGGSDELVIGSTRVDSPVLATKPRFEFAPQTRDRVSQQTAGVSYELRRARRAELSAGLQRTFYDKSVTSPDLSEARTEDSPLLYNLSGAFNLTPRLTAYASHTRGLEEAGVAPEFAINRHEALPAIHTRQSDAGLRFAFTPTLRLLAGAFEVRKPYFTLDAARRFAAFGDATHRGLEVSFSGAATPRVNLVVGAVAMRPRVDGPDVIAGVIGKRAVGQAELNLLFNADWRPTWLRNTSLDIAIRHTADMPATRDNLVELPSRTLLDLGARYQFEFRRAPATLRVQVTNLTDEYGFDLRGSGAYDLIPGRKVSGYVAVDW